MKRAIPILAIGLLLPHPALSATIRVPDEWQTISLAIGAAQNGDTVLVGPGIYHEFPGIYIIGKAVHVRSEGGAEVTTIENYPEPPTPDSGSFAFDIRSTPGPCTIEGFTMSHHVAGDMGMNGFTIYVQNAIVRIAHNRFVSNSYFWVIWIESSQSVEIENNLFYDNNATAISAWQASDLAIRSNTFSNPDKWQIYARTINGHLTISRNVIVDGARGIVTSCPVENITCTCNDVWNNDINYDGTLGNQTGTDGNISADPLFCGIIHTGNFYLQGVSPCAGANVPAPCGSTGMGAYPAACTVGVEKSSWGSLKRIYR